jgi:hypothetical protein
MVPVSYFTPRCRLIGQLWIGRQWEITFDISGSRAWYSRRPTCAELGETVRCVLLRPGAVLFC